MDTPKPVRPAPLGPQPDGAACPRPRRGPSAQHMDTSFLSLTIRI